MLHLPSIIDDFLDYFESLEKSNETIRAYKSDLNGFLQYVIRRYDIDSVDENHLQRFVYNYVDTIRTYGDGQKYASSSRSRKRTAIRVFMQFLYKRNYISINIAQGIESIAQKETASNITLTQEEIQAISGNLVTAKIEASTPTALTKSIRNELLFFIFIYTGMRVSEVCELAWSDIDLDNHSLLVRKGKGKKERTIPIHEKLLEPLLLYKQNLEKRFLPGHPITKGYLFYRSAGVSDKPMTQKNMRKIVKQWLEDAKIEKEITPHSLRHTFASHSIRNGMSITTLSHILGHKRVSITLDVYSHVIDEMQKKTEMQKLEY